MRVLYWIGFLIVFATVTRLESGVSTFTEALITGTIGILLLFTAQAIENAL